MELRLLRRHVNSRARPQPDGTVDGVARLDRRTKRLVGRLKPGNLAIIDHEDVDRMAAESLIEHGVGAVVNAKKSISGRYPNLGPILLARAGVPLLDDVGDEVFDRVREGDEVRMDGDRLLVGEEVVAKGRRLDEDDISSLMDDAHTRLSQTVERFAENTLEYVRREQDILLRALRAPELRTQMAGRHALVITRGYHYKDDLHALRGYVREMKPVIVAVDGAADACLAIGARPHIIFGDMDSVSTEALRCGAELLVHGYADGVAPGLPRVEALGLDCKVVTAPGTSEDVAMLLAHEQGAELIVAVGSHTSMVEFLDKGRAGMASTFLARLRIGPSLVDAKGVSQLYRTRVRTRDLVFLVLAALVTMVIVTIVSRPMRLYWESIWQMLEQFLFRLRGSF